MVNGTTTTGPEISALLTLPGDRMSLIVVGALVRCPAHPEWGVGQIQSVIGPKVTVTFEHAGKRVFLDAGEALELVEPERY